ncbi:uncharacterized protein H6S33_010560 [Morchella sextelata]|uniref:uncharacterized protein n=1 Tax=Morchella sextelata TaxID=1174677 RepID=UPI001D044DCF|nr:uncharacterized protein H6S33_010560 [Morchella sextelata]KAH0611295.1 hypothetical protein H6S33_010560 [Morchella sextelata]
MSEKGLLSTIALQEKRIKNLTDLYHRRHTRSVDLKKKCDGWRHKRCVSESGPRAYWNKDLEEESKLKTELAALLEEKSVEERTLKALLGEMEARLAKKKEEEWEDEEEGDAGEEEGEGEGDQEEEDREELRAGEAVVWEKERGGPNGVEWRAAQRAEETENDVRMLEQQWTKQTDNWEDGNSWDEQVEPDRLGLWIPLRMDGGTALWG